MPVESTKSQNITVTCRRSPMAAVGGGATGANWAGSVVWGSLASTSGGKGSDADGDFPGSSATAAGIFSAVPKQTAAVLEVLIGKMGKDRDVDAVLRECAGVLGQAEPCEPIGYFLHRRPR